MGKCMLAGNSSMQLMSFAGLHLDIRSKHFFVLGTENSTKIVHNGIYSGRFAFSRSFPQMMGGRIAVASD